MYQTPEAALSTTTAPVVPFRMVACFATMSWRGKTRYARSTPRSYSMSLRCRTSLSPWTSWEAYFSTRSRTPSANVTLRHGSAKRKPPQPGYSISLCPASDSNA